MLSEGFAAISVLTGCAELGEGSQNPMMMMMQADCLAEEHARSPPH